MKKEKINFEGIQMEVEKYDHEDKDAKRRMLAYCFRVVRQESGMNRKDFAESLFRIWADRGIP